MDKRPIVHPEKAQKVMHEFKHGTLHSGSAHGPHVTNRAQALAIMESEMRNKKYADGGQVAGPGDGTSDSVTAQLSNGKYVIPAEVVHFLGVGFLDRLVQQAQMQIQQGQQAPGPWDAMAQDEMGGMTPGGTPNSMPPKVA